MKNHDRTRHVYAFFSHVGTIATNCKSDSENLLVAGFVVCPCGIYSKVLWAKTVWVQVIASHCFHWLLWRQSLRVSAFLQQWSQNPSDVVVFSGVLSNFVPLISLGSSFHHWTGDRKLFTSKPTTPSLKKASEIMIDIQKELHTSGLLFNFFHYFFHVKCCHINFSGTCFGRTFLPTKTAISSCTGNMRPAALILPSHAMMASLESSFWMAWPGRFGPKTTNTWIKYRRCFFLAWIHDAWCKS